LEDTYGVKKMRVAVDVLESVREPYLQVHHEHVVGMQLRPGFIEMGLRRSEMTMVTLEAGEIGRSRRAK
jgi:hypothetical protein